MKLKNTLGLAIAQIIRQQFRSQRYEMVEEFAAKSYQR